MPPRGGKTDGAVGGRGFLHGGQVSCGVPICGRLDVREGRREKVSCSLSIRDVMEEGKKNNTPGCFLISTDTIIAFNCFYYFFVCALLLSASFASASPAKQTAHHRRRGDFFAQVAIPKMSFTRWEKQTSEMKKRTLKRQCC